MYGRKALETFETGDKVLFKPYIDWKLVEEVDDTFEIVETDIDAENWRKSDRGDWPRGISSRFPTQRRQRKKSPSKRTKPDPAAHNGE